MSSPKISVLTSVFNSAELLRPALESVLNQTFADFEWIIINDATPDNSIDILESYNDPRIKIFHNEANKGLAASLNKGLGLCTGEYIARMDTDDVCRLNRFEQQVKFLDSHPEIAIAGSWVNLTGDWSGTWKTPVSHEDIQCKLIFNSPMAHPSVMMRKSALDKFSLRYDETLRRIQDYDLWVRASQVVRMANIPEILLDYRIDIQAKTPEVVKRANEVIYAIRQRQLDKLGITLSETEADNLHFISANQMEKVDVKVANQLFSRMLSENKKKKAFKPSALERHLGRTWLRLAAKKPSVFFSTKPGMYVTAMKSLFV